MKVDDHVTFHADADGQRGIPARDALIGIYAAYYIGSHDREIKDHHNYNFNLRARNAFNMGQAMDHAFGQPDSPWVVLDHRSDKRRDGQNTTHAMGGAHFIALYHRASGRVMVAMPGLESDDNPGDTLMDLAEMMVGGMRKQSKALHDYVREVEGKIARQEFKDADGAPLTVQGDIVIGAHSMGCTAAQMMALGGYKTVLVEPRPIHDGLIKRIAGNYAQVTGTQKLDDDAVMQRLDASTVNIRSTHSNVWNSIILPWVRQREAGQNFAYGIEGKNVTPADRGIGTFHRVEFSVPSLNGNTEAKAYEANVTLAPSAGGRKLVDDITRKPAK